jgi:hypothetical protein
MSNARTSVAENEKNPPLVHARVLFIRESLKRERVKNGIT